VWCTLPIWTYVGTYRVIPRKNNVRKRSIVRTEQRISCKVRHGSSEKKLSDASRYLYLAAKHYAIKPMATMLAS
jgi:hypothetical protein